MIMSALIYFVIIVSTLLVVKRLIFFKVSAIATKDLSLKLFYYIIKSIKSTRKVS